MTDPYVVDWVKTIDAIPGTEFYFSPGIDDDSDNTYVSYLSERLNEQSVRIREVAVMQLRKTDGHIGWTKKISIGFDETKPLSNFAASIAVDSTHIYVTYNDQENTDVHVMKLDKNNTGNLVWTRNYSINVITREMNVSRAISVGPSGLYLTYCTNTNTVEIFKINQETGVIQWNKKTNNNINSELAPSSYNYPSIAVYSDGIYLTFVGDGIFSGSGNTNLDSTKYDIVVMKMTKAGQIVWTKQTPEFNTADYDSEPSIAVDASGVYVTYTTQGTVAGNTNSGGQDIVVFKLDLDGTFGWAKQTPDFNTADNDSRPSIALYGSGVYVTYKFSSDIAIIHLAKSSGEIVWRRTSPNQRAGENLGPTIAVYSDGIYVTYAISGIISGDENTSSGSFDIVVMKLDTQGVVVWTKQRSTFNTSGFDGNPLIAVDATGVYVTYGTDGTVPGNTNSGLDDIVVFKLDLDGNFGWAKQTPSFNTSEYEYTRAIAVDASGVYVTYTLYRSGGGVDRIAVVKLSKVDGAFEWNTQTSPDARLEVGGSFVNMAINDTGVYVVSNYNKTISGSQRQQIKVIKIFKNSGGVDWVQESEDINNMSGNNSKPTIAADASGVYVTYQTDINVNGDSDIVVVKMTSAGVFEWREQTPSMNTEGNDSEPTIALDSSYIYVAYSNDLAGNSDIYVMKMRKDDKSVEWLEKPELEAAAAITTDNDTKPKIAVNANGIYVTYETRAPDAPGVYTRIAVIRVSDSGALIWRKEAENKPTQQYLFDRASIAVDDTGVYVTGSAIDSAPGEENTNSGKTDIVVFKLNLDGAFGWVTQTPSFNTSDDDIEPRIAIDATGIYVTYVTEDTVPGSGNTNSGQKDIVVFKLNKDGTFVWTKQTSEFNTGLPDGEPSIAVDSSGVYVTYTTQGGTVAGEGNTNSGQNDIVVFKLDLDGTFGWAKQTPSFNTQGYDTNPSIAVDATGVYVTYSKYNSVNVLELAKNTGEFVRRRTIVSQIEDIAPSIATDSTAVYVAYSTNDVSLGSENVNSGSFDIVVMKMDTNGNVLWRKQRPSFNTTQRDGATVIAVDASGVYVTYIIEDGTVAGDGNTNSGLQDIAVLKLNLDGTFSWAKQTPSFNTPNEDVGSLIALDATGVYVIYNTLEADYSYITMSVVKLGKDTGSITWVKPNIGSGGSNYYVDTVVDTTGVYFTNLRNSNGILDDEANSIVVTKMIEPEPICLLEGTLVRTPTGSVPIELVKKDDYVLNQEYKPVRVVLTSKTTFEYKTNPTSDYELDNVLYTIPAGTLGATSNVYLTRHHRFVTSDGTMKKPEEYGLKRSEASEVCKTNDLYTVYHLRLEDEYNNHFIVNGDCIVEDWWDWPRPDGL